MNQNTFFTIVILVLGITSLSPNHGVAIAAARSFGREVDYRQVPELMPLTDPELNLEAAIKHREQQQQQLDGFTRKLPFSSNGNGNNGPDVAASIQNPMRQQKQQQYLRVQRSPAASQQQFPLQQQAAINLQLEDEQALRQALPDLIAQARTDKAVERALLRMLISAGLRQRHQPLAATGGVQYLNWRPDERQEGADGGPILSPGLSARLEQAVAEEYAGADPSQFTGSGDGDFGQASFGPDQYPLAVGKRGREYIKPCSFNAVSCAKNPYRLRK